MVSGLPYMRSEISWKKSGLIYENFSKMFRMKGARNMEVKNGEKRISIPGWVIAAGIATVGTIVADICKTIGMKRK